MLNITITINGNVSPEDLAKIAGLVKGYDPYHTSSEQSLPVEETPEEKPKRTTKPKAEPVAEEQPAEAADAPADDEASNPSIDDVKAAATALIKANGREALAELLAEYKAENLSGVAAGKRAAFIAAAEAKIK